MGVDTAAHSVRAAASTPLRVVGRVGVGGLVSPTWFSGVMNTPRDPSHPQYNPRRDFTPRIRPDAIPALQGLTDKAQRRALDTLLHGPVKPFTRDDLTALQHEDVTDSTN